MSCDKALVFDIQDFCVQDGPGIRTTIFFKGCPLKCIWCSNPEGQNIYPELFHSIALCKKSHKCLTTCPYNAAAIGTTGYPDFNRNICKECNSKDCVNTCYNDALKVMGQSYTVDEIVEKVKPNIPFFKNSNGGITLSGGEPFLQYEYVEKLVNKCNESGISVGVETCGYFNWSDVSSYINNFEFVYFDLKTFNEEIHKKATGKSNKKILSNLKKLSVDFSDKIIVSIPVIPDVNDNEIEIKNIAGYCKELNIKKIRLLPYHDYGREKYSALGMNYKMLDTKEITSDILEAFKSIILSYGIECWVE
ncbi:MAG: glycyl-radical enzyme activating protein [Ignavibacteriae bacterium]|nr:MAG: glycyl-radical enzyme activating protein [Ignavibacteriota bacterium]